MIGDTENKVGRGAVVRWLGLHNDLGGEVRRPEDSGIKINASLSSLGDVVDGLFDPLGLED